LEVSFRASGARWGPFLCLWVISKHLVARASTAEVNLASYCLLITSEKLEAVFSDGKTKIDNGYFSIQLKIQYLDNPTGQV